MKLFWNSPLGKTMPEYSEQTDSMFPLLGDAQIARLAPFGEQRQYEAGAVLFDQGDVHHGVFIVLGGSIELVGISTGGETMLRTLGRGVFTGELNHL
jgi:thioredoxin reductase (NADPH)